MTSSDYIYEHSYRLEQEFRRTRERARAIAAQKVEARIDDELGYVRVAGSGQLVEIHLEPRVFQRMNPSTLGPRIITAIAAAEEKAAALRATLKEESAWRRD